MQIEFPLAQMLANKMRVLRVLTNQRTVRLPGLGTELGFAREG